MSRSIFVVSDTHFNHANILKFLDKDGKIFRPFSCVEEMNETMIDRWNERVRDEDIIYHLGDVYVTNGQDANEILKRLRGRKRLVLGNHDNGKDQLLQRHFQKISIWRMWPEFKLLFTHVPVNEQNLRGFINVHGHIHQNDSPSELYFNACVEKTNWAPISVEEIIGSSN